MPLPPEALAYLAVGLTAVCGLAATGVALDRHGEQLRQVIATALPPTDDDTFDTTETTP